MSNRIDPNTARDTYTGPELSEAPAPTDSASAEAPDEASREAQDLIELSQSVATRRPLGEHYELSYGMLLSSIPPDGKRTFSLAIKGGEELVAKGHLRATVEHDAQGGYSLSLEAGAGGGVGVDDVLTSAEATAEASGKVTLHFDSLTQAASWLSAATQKENEASLASALGPLGAWGMRHFEDRDVDQRLARTLSDVKSVEGSLTLDGELKARMLLAPGVSMGNLRLGLGDKASFKVDFQTGTLTLENQATLEGAASLGPSSADGKGADRRGSSFTLLGGSAEGSILARTTYQLSPAQLQGLKSGKLSPAQLMRSLSDVKATQELVAQVGCQAPDGTRYEGERVLLAQDLSHPFDVHGGGWKWEASQVEAASVGVDVGVVELRGSASTETKLGEAESLDALSTEVQQRLAREAQDADHVTAMRALQVSNALHR